MTACEASFIQRETSRPLASLDTRSQEGVTRAMLSKGKINYVTCRLFQMTGFRVQLPLLTLGFLCCFPGERIRAHKAEEPTLGESTACTKNTKNVQGLFCSSARLSLGAAALPCPCLSALHPQREPGPFRLAGIWFNFTVLPAPWPPPPRTGAHVGCTPRGLLTSHSCRTGPVHCCPTHPPPLYSGTYQGKES